MERDDSIESVLVGMWQEPDICKVKKSHYQIKETPDYVVSIRHCWIPEYSGTFWKFGQTQHTSISQPTQSFLQI